MKQCMQMLSVSERRVNSGSGLLEELLMESGKPRAFGAGLRAS